MSNGQHSRFMLFIGGIVWAAIFGGCVFAAALYLKDTAELMVTGVETVATVSDYRSRRCGSRKRRRICHVYTIVAPEIGRKEFTNRHNLEVGSRIWITYAQTDRSNVRPGSKPTFSNFDALEWGAVAAVLGFGFMCMASIWQSVRALFGIGYRAKL